MNVTHTTRIDACIMLCVLCTNWQHPPFPFPEKQKQGSIAFGTVMNQELFYEFDAFITTAGTHFEQPFKEDFQQVFSRARRKRFDKLFPTKQSQNSIVWRLQIIRNRVVHPDEPTYSRDGGRHLEFSSSGANCFRDTGELKIQANLIDIADSEDLRRFLKEAVIEPTKQIKKMKTSGVRPELPDFHRLLFARGKKQGKNPNIVRSRGCDLVKSFSGILHEMLNYLMAVNQLFKDEMLERLQWDSKNEVYLLPGLRGTVCGHYESTPADNERDYIVISELFR